MAMKLYSSWRASAPYRVRIGLQLKGLNYDYVGVDLAASEQHKAPYRAVNPQRLTPTLEVDGVTLTQSLAILEWLDETHPEPPLLPKGAAGPRRRCAPWPRSWPATSTRINNLRVLRALDAMGVEAEPVQTWARRWIADGFNVLEAMISKPRGGAGRSATAPTIADCCLIPQVYNSQRFGVELDRLSRHPRRRTNTRGRTSRLSSPPTRTRKPDAVQDLILP